MDKVEITITGRAFVPAKYAPLIHAMMAQAPDSFQEMANQMIAMTRMEAAKHGVEVDDLIAAAIKEQDDQKDAA